MPEHRNAARCIPDRNRVGIANQIQNHKIKRESNQIKAKSQAISIHIKLDE
jgi:hypothetical protein